MPKINKNRHRQAHREKVRKENMEYVNKLKEEIAKCDLVCSNCHRDRTHRRRNS